MIRLISKFFHLKWRYLLSGSVVYVEKGSHFVCAKNAKIKHSKIHLQRNSSFEVGANTEIVDTIFSIKEGKVVIGESSKFFKGDMSLNQRITISKGTALFGNFNRISAKKIWIRFGGSLNFGDYIFLNSSSDVRCDESITVGDFTQFSYNVKLWDTNTHEIEPIEQRRSRWIEKGLGIDSVDKPMTKPVVIGSDNWIGDSVTILKGTVTGVGCICGTGTFLSGKTIPDRTTVVNKVELKMFTNGL